MCTLAYDACSMACCHHHVGPAGMRMEDVRHDFMVALLRRDLLIRAPGVSWTDIAGLEEAKRVLQENVILPLLMPDYFQGIRRPVKVLTPSL